MKNFATILVCILVQINTSVKGQDKLLAGTLTKEVVRLDATEIFDFHEGFAVVKRYQEYAIIKNDGTYLFNYGKYILNSTVCYFSNGMCAVKDAITEKYGFINSTGSLIVPCIYDKVKPFSEDNYGWVSEYKNGSSYNSVSYFVNKKGERFKSKLNENEGLSDNVFDIYHIQGKDNYKEFYHKNGKFVFKTKRNVVGLYSEGLIKVDTTFGNFNLRYGFIDTMNRLVIPYQIKASNVSDFYEDIAHCSLNESSGLSDIFINKKGETVLQFARDEKYCPCHVTKQENDSKYYHGRIIMRTNVPIANPVEYSNFNTREELTVYDINKTPIFLNSKIESDPYVKSRKFTSITVSEFILHNGYGSYLFDGGIIFRATYSWDEYEYRVPGGVSDGKPRNIRYTTNGNGEGIVDYEGNIIIPPVFESLFKTDTESRLTKAVFITKEKETIEGYVDNNGIFKIIKSKKNAN
jgi:hypothetical protein